MHTCEFCNKVCTNKGAFATHTPYCKQNPNRVQRKTSENAHRKAGTPAWNKGITLTSLLEQGKITEEQYNRRIDAARKSANKSGKAATPEKEQERIRKIKEKAKISNGGYRHGSGRGKKGWYHGIFCDSSWELAFLIYHIEHDIKIERCTQQRKYTFNNKPKQYNPDFIVNNQIIEIKGYDSEQWQSKMEANPDIIVIYEKDMKPYLEYAISKYGKNFINLYELAGHN